MQPALYSGQERPGRFSAAAGTAEITLFAAGHRPQNLYEGGKDL